MILCMICIEISVVRLRWEPPISWCVPSVHAVALVKLWGWFLSRWLPSFQRFPSHILLSSKGYRDWLRWWVKEYWGWGSQTSMCLPWAPHVPDPWWSALLRCVSLMWCLDYIRGLTWPRIIYILCSAALLFVIAFERVQSSVISYSVMIGRGYAIVCWSVDSVGNGRDTLHKPQRIEEMPDRS